VIVGFQRMRGLPFLSCPTYATVYRDGVPNRDPGVNHEDRDSDSRFSTTILSQILICHDTYVDESGPPFHEQVMSLSRLSFFCVPRMKQSTETGSRIEKGVNHDSSHCDNGTIITVQKTNTCMISGRRALLTILNLMVFGVNFFIVVPLSQSKKMNMICF